MECSVIAEFLLERYPTVEGSRQASGLLIQSQNFMLDSIPDTERKEEFDRIIQLSDQVIKRYPGSKEAVLAAKTVTQLAIADNDLDTACKYFETVPTSSSSYGELSIKVGRAAWFEYLAQRQIRQNNPPAADEALIKKRLDQSGTYLEKGIQAQGSQITYAAALGALYLVDVYLELGRVDDAVNQLETESIAPIDLVKQKHPVVLKSTSADAFIAKAYKTAIKTYLAALRKNPNNSSWIDKSQGIMQAMRENARRSNDPNTKKNVDNIYRLIALELKQQFESIENPAEQSQYVDSLTQFLDTIQTDTEDPNMARWAGSTLVGIGEVLGNKPGQKEQANELFQKGLRALEQAQKLGLNDPALMMDVQRKTATAKRGLGRFEEAVNILKDLLKQRPNDVGLQLEAVETLQTWGVQTKRSRALADALMGTERVRTKNNRTQNLIWGWEQLVRALKDNPKLQSAYYQSLFGMVEARFEYGMIENNEKAKKAALRLLTRARERDKDLGGPNWKSKLDALESKIRKSL